VNIIEEIRNVLDIEVEALESVARNLTPRFEDCVRLVAACQGQVVVTGIGKSGIIGQKIAATLRSTGTPSVFLHPADALHGDLGIVRPEDIVLALGKSGESHELNELLGELRSVGVQIIAVTSDAASSMAGLSDVVLELRIPREACPHNLAPTSSTTAALAVGDAIAIALMKLNGMSRDEFASRHPGGQLGRRLRLAVADVMRKGSDNPVISVGESVREMLARITEFRVGAISVVDEAGVLMGLITDFDVRKALESQPDIFSMELRQIMNPEPATVSGEMKAVEALTLMRERSKPTAVIPVVDEGRRAIGMLHVHDLITAGL
jgi:arabinose-5-phosphate isomerase